MNKRKIIIIVAVILALLITCCGAFWLSFSNDSGSGMELLADALKNIDGEPTAFQPYNYTATPTSEAQPITDALVPNPGLIPPDGQVNILVLGSDWRADSGYRTDIVLLVSVYTKENKVSLVSFPRDLWVDIPGLTEERINTAMGYGGFPLLASVFEYNFAIPIDHYIMTNFYGFNEHSGTHWAGLRSMPPQIHTTAATFHTHMVRITLWGREPHIWMARQRSGMCAPATPPTISTARGAPRKFSSAFSRN